MLVIQRRGSSLGGMGRYYYRGSGMLDAITRTLFYSGIKKVINSGTSSAIAHKVADAVVNGATSRSKNVANAIAKELTSTSASAVKTAIDSVVKKERGTKRLQSIPAAAAEPSIIVQPPPLKRMKINIDSLIDCSGIVYDELQYSKQRCWLMRFSIFKKSMLKVIQLKVMNITNISRRVVPIATYLVTSPSILRIRTNFSIQDEAISS